MAAGEEAVDADWGVEEAEDVREGEWGGWFECGRDSWGEGGCGVGDGGEVGRGRCCGFGFGAFFFWFFLGIGVCCGSCRRRCPWRIVLCWLRIVEWW